MPSFEPRPDSLITSEMLRQDFIPDADEVLRLIHLDEAATGTDTAISLAVGAICVVSAGGCLALAGLTAPILVPLFGIGAMAIASWNSRITQSDRQRESMFVHDQPEILTAVKQKADSGEDMHKIANAFETAYRAYLSGGKPQLKATAEVPTAAPCTEQKDGTCGQCVNFKSGSSTGGLSKPGWGECAVYPVVPVRETDSIPPLCTKFKVAKVGATTQLGAIPVQATAIDTPAEPPTTYPMAAKEVSKDDRAALIARLNQDCPALVKLIKSHPIRLTGTQRSGKSTIAKILGLLRMVLLPGHGVIAATPHYEPANPYPKVFTVAGVTPQGKRDYAAIERQWFGMADKVESCQQSNVSYVWDEFGLFDQAIADTDDDKDKIKRVLTSCLRETMKFGIYPMFIVHGETAAFLPGSKGLVTVFLNSTVRVEAIGEQIEDEMGLPTLRPTGRFNVTYLDGTKDEGKLPDWLTESYLLGLIGDQAVPKVAESERFERKQDVKMTNFRKSKIMVPTHQKVAVLPTYEAQSNDAELDLDDDSIDEGELAVRAEVKRFLIENPDGAKVKDFVNRARKPVRKMPSDDVKFVLELMELEAEIYSVDGAYFTKAN